MRDVFGQLRLLNDVHVHGCECPEKTMRCELLREKIRRLVITPGWSTRRDCTCQHEVFDHEFPWASAPGHCTVSECDCKLYQETVA